jgi:hypothetical protein
VTSDVINHCFVAHLRRLFVFDRLLIHALTARLLNGGPSGLRLGCSNLSRCVTPGQVIEHLRRNEPEERVPLRRHLTPEFGIQG